jgi:predicted nucleic acid-binding protein
LPDCFEIIGVDNVLIGLLMTQLNIGVGEAAVITYALYEKSDITCFIDDKRARNIAKSLHLKISGSIGILMKMEKKGLISSAYEEALKLFNAGFHLSNKLLDQLK